MNLLGLDLFVEAVIPPPPFGRFTSHRKDEEVEELGEVFANIVILLSSFY